MRSLHVLAGAIGAVLGVPHRAAACLHGPRHSGSAIFVRDLSLVVYLQRFATTSDHSVCLAALTVYLGTLRFTEQPAWRPTIALGAGLLLGALAKLPVGFELTIAAPVALLLMPAASRRALLDSRARLLLLVAHVPVVLLAVLILAIALLRVQRGQSPGFGLSDFLGLGLGQYRGIGATMGAAPITLLGELTAQLSRPVMVIGAVGVAVAVIVGDWRSRWLAALAAVPLLAIGTLASFWFSRYLLFTLPPLIVLAVAGWNALYVKCACGRGAIQQADWLRSRWRRCASPAATRWAASPCSLCSIRPPRIGRR